MSFERELQVSLRIVSQIRDEILKIYNSKDFGVEIKSDNSPVTKADKLVDEFIRKELQKEFPSYSLLTEESADDFSRLENDYVFIVDPIDGTKDFIARNGEFTVDIGLSYKHQTVMGVILLPVTGEIYYATKGNGSFYLKDKDSRPIQIHTSDKLNDLCVVTSRCHFNDVEKKTLEKYGNKISSIKSVGSTIKGCQIARGLADYHFRFSEHTKEWDTCAMQIVVEEAGGFLLNLEGKALTYNRKDVYNHGGYVICNRIENFLI